MTAKSGLCSVTFFRGDAAFRPIRLTGPGKSQTDLDTDMTDQPIKRSRKRIIRRDNLPASKLSNTKKPPAPKSKKKRPTTTAPKRPLVTPSAKRLDNLNASLNAFPVWLE